MLKLRTVGGVTYDEKELVKAYENPEQNKYTVELKDGTVIIYPMHDFAREAEVVRSPEGRLDFKGLKDAVVIDTPKNDIYRFMGCNNIIVNADNGGDSDLIEVTNRRLSTGEIQISEGNRFCMNKNDIYNLHNSTGMSFVLEDTDIDA